ncbi:MAG: hypothetical protein L3J91_06090 [Thermoplasmata archaeon]|nr:hypothetical protein [Thermoplasmata archaeon]
MSLLPPFETVYTNNPLTRSLFEKAGFRVESPELVDRARFEGARVREAIRSGGPWRELVPPSVAAYLDELRAEARLQLLVERPRPPAKRPAP